jgi:hypothetical protein
MVKIFFGIITRQAIRRGTFASVRDLVGALQAFIDGWNDRCGSFVWPPDRRPNPQESQPSEDLRRAALGGPWGRGSKSRLRLSED